MKKNYNMKKTIAMKGFIAEIWRNLKNEKRFIKS